jgi:hypothetical protein
MKPKLPRLEQPGASEFERFDNLFRKVISVPKSEVDRRESEWKKDHRKRQRKKKAQH